MALGGSQTTVGVTLAANMDPSGVLNAVKQMQGAFSGLKLPGNIGADLEKSFNKATDLLKKYQTQLSKGINTKTDAKNITKTGSQINEVLDEIVTHINSINGQQIFLKADVSDLNTLKANIEDARTAWKNAIQEFRKGSDIEKVLNEIVEKTTRSNLTQGSISSAKTLFDKGDLEGYRNALDDIYNRLKNLKDTTIKNVVENLGLQDAGSKVANLDQIKKRLEDISKIDFSEDSNVDTKFKAITAAVTEYETEVKRANQAGQDAFNNINVDKTVKDTRNLVDATDQYKNSVMSAKDQVQQLQQSTQYFFSLRNMINLLKRGIDEAVQSVKELDKAMTETAVVTDYKVSDLWGMLPEYTKVANQLGATTQGAYETMTLYYQQGLEQQQAFELGAETMKMARIAGLDYAETTDMMTAALRGFNMELNETSAKRVNDVYSELAAITASDTEELGTAMQRTASIAASAGASFEGTTAFLAQAIETTREPAENIGTAMKTIVARFQEMKKNPLEISEVDGEEVDYNKIDAALKTIGVDLKDTNGQFRDFDQVMLDISARWDSLSQSQQRYIATTAAGSRQQSRFIAMVSNYERTMQLMEAANNSAGASDEQFGKTMDSLESKLNQLHNAWQQFTMGIANNGMIKMAVDGLTGFLNITNKIIDTLSLGSGALKSFLSVFAAFTGLKMAGRGANALIGGLGGLVDPKSSVKEGLKIGLFGQGKNAAQAKAITTPIVGSLSKISGQIAAIAKRQGIKDAGQKGSTAGVKETSKEDYANTKRLFSQLSGKEGFKMDEASKLFRRLDTKHQLSMFNNSPGTKQAMKKASLDWFGTVGSSLGMSKDWTKQGQQYISSIYEGMKQGRIPVDKGIELIGQPQKWGKYFGDETALAYSKSFIKKTIPAMKESRQTAHELAMASLGFNPSEYGVGSDNLKALFKDKNNAQLKKEYADLYKGFMGDLERLGGHGEAKGVVSNMGRFANDIGSVADKFTQAGYGITTFGNALSQLGGPLDIIGSGIAAFGGAVSTIGASISGATGIISLFTVGLQDAAGATIVAGSTIAAVAAPLAAAAAAFLLVRAHIKKVKEAGEEVTKTFNETNKTVSDNISKLKSYQSEFAVLSKGIDSNGNNVSLDDSQYQRYLEIVEDIAAINPSIVEGYNAQGHAIINNNKALAETLKLQEESQKKALKDYTNTDSLQKLINARNLNNDFKGINIKGSSPGVYDGSGHGTEGRQKPIGLGKDVSTIADQLRLLQGTDALGNTIRINDEMLQKYGIESLDALISGEEQAVKNFIKHRDKIQADLTNSGFELSESVTKGFEKLGEDSAAFDAAIQPVYDNLLANVSNSKVFESIAPEFREALNMGLKDLASQDLDAPEMAKAANNMAARFANLTNGSGKYKDALDIVEKAQNDFASSLDETQYQADVQPAIDDLIRLKEEALDEGSAYGDALAEYLENQIQRISHFTEEGGANLSEALNTATDDIAAAEGALDSFNEATKKDFSTAAEGMKGIFDKTTETFKDSYGTEIQKHAEGMGDATFWTGAEALLSGKEIERLTKGKDGYEAAEAVKKSIEGLEPMLREGQEGFDAFTDRVLENADAMDKLAEAGVEYDKESGLITNIPEDQWHNVAEALGISDDLLTSILNKGRQFADISFMNVEEARKALATSDYTIEGKSSTAGNKNLYVKEDTLRMELSNAGYVRKEQQDEQIQKLLAQGVKTIPASDSKELTQDKLKAMADDWGIRTLPDLIQTLNDTGDFTKDEIQEYAEKLDLIGDLDFDTVYSDLISALDNPELAKQTQELAELHGTTTAILDQMSGNTPEKQMQDAESLRKDTFGGDGVDTAVEAFGQGKKLGKNGTLEFMTQEEFAVQSKYVSDLVSDYNKAAEQAQINADATTGATSESYQKVADYYTKLAADTQREYERGLANYESNLQRQEKAAKATADREDSVRKAKIAKLEKNQSNKSKTPGQTKTNNVETTTKKTKTEKTETTTQTTIVDGEITPGFEESKQAAESLENKDGTVVNIATKAELAGANSVIKSLGGINNKEVTVATKGDTSGADTVKTAIANVTGKIVTIGTKLGNTAAIKTIDDKISALARKGNNIKIGTTVAVGQNNYIPHQSIPSFGSAARGRGGTVGPRNKGGLTLTGEKGFEIAWLPKENRSMILGAGGPQMLNLPSDAVVYTHEQSKQILKRKGIPAGSHAASESASGSSYKKAYNRGGSSSNTITNYVKSKGDSSSKKIKQAADEAIKVTQKAGKVLVWWENAGLRMDKAQRNAEAAQRKLENLLKTFGTTAEEYKKSGEEYRKYLKQQIKVASEKETRATQELGYTANGGNPVQTKTKDQAAQQAKAKTKLDKAKKAYKKSKTKANKKKLNKAQKAYNNTAGAKADAANNAYLEAIGALQEVSYEVTTTKKGKKTKKTKTAKINTASYITQDKETGAYQLDQKAIDRLAATNKSYAEAVKQATEKQLNDILNKQKEAEEEKLKAEEALAEFYNTTYDTFYAWEKTITEAYLLSQQLEKLSGLRNIYSAVEDLELAKAEAGYADLTKGLEKLTNALNKNKDLMLEQVNANRKLIDARYEEYQSMLSMEDVLANVAAMDDAYKEVSNPETLKAVNDADARKRALEFLQEIGATNNFDYDAAVKALNSQTWNKDDYDKIKDGLDQIAEKQTAYYEAITQTYESMTEVYQTIEEYQSYMADFEKDLISGMEEQANKEIDKLSKLSSVIDTAAKDLIDEVKRKLDERRKQEDNAKTEQDIAQKQQRLAALRADTSGGHQVEIAQLEKEIAEAQQSYGRTLEDQLLDKLSQQQDEAAKQRERQIQLLEAQRDFAAATGLNVEQINQWLQDPKQNEDQIRAAWLANQGYEDAGSLERKQLEESFDAAWMKFLAYGEALPQLEQITEEDLIEKEPESPTLDSINTIKQSVDDIVSLLGTKGIKIQSLSIADAKTDSYEQERSVGEIKRMMEANGQSVSAKNFESEGFALSDITKEYTAKELHDEGYDLNTIKGFYNSKALKDAGYTASDFATAEMSYADARSAGFSTGELSKLEAYKTLAAQEDQQVAAAKAKQAVQTAYNNFLVARGSAKNSGDKNWGKIGKKGYLAQVQRGVTLQKSEYQVAADLAATKALGWTDVLDAAKDAGRKGKTVKAWNKGASKTSNFRKAFEKVYGKWSKYATGGLADYTGPAWLDGTPSKPELVLNATDTRNFLALRDVLSKAIGTTNSVTNSYGGNATYEININVDKIEKDYDVDRVAERVKKIIVKDSGYRNVTQVRNFR